MAFEQVQVSAVGTAHDAAALSGRDPPKKGSLPQAQSHRRRTDADESGPEKLSVSLRGVILCFFVFPSSFSFPCSVLLRHSAAADAHGLAQRRSSKSRSKLTGRRTMRPVV